jgi:glycosyltransferase involved in cell wall biosynthesis
MFDITINRLGPTRKYTPTVGNILARIKFVKEAIDFGKSLDVDIVDGSNFISHFIAKNISRSKKIPSVAWYPDVWIGAWLKNGGLFGVFGEILERLNLFLGFDCYIAISAETAKKLKKHVKGKINIIPCGVDQKEFAVPVRKFDNPTIICVSRLAKYKNLKTLILAFAHLTTKLTDARLIIVGSGPEYNHLRNQTKGLKIDSKVKFFANLSRKELVRLIKSSHVFSLPSPVEGFGISTIESACARLPYVISNIAVHREITKGGQGGFLVDPYDAISFSERFLNLLKDDALYEEKSRKAQNLAKQYNWQQISQKTESIYSKCISDTMI